MLNTKYLAKLKKKEEILFGTKQSQTSLYLWKDKSFLGRLYLVPHYLLAYGLMFNLYILYYVAGKAYGIPYYIIALVGLFGDGATYTQLFCLLFVIWSFVAGITLRLFLAHPKRLQWFYDIVGEKRVKPILFQSPLLSFLFSRTSLAMAGIMLADEATEVACEQQHQYNKQSALEAAHKAAQNQQEAALKRSAILMQQVDDPKQKAKLSEALIAEQKEISKQYYLTRDKINARPRTTQSLMRALLQAEKSRDTLKGVDNLSKTVLGSIFWGWGEGDKKK